MNYFELYPGDYLRDTTRLSLVEHGAYLRLMLAYYGEEQPLPADYTELFTIVSAVGSADKAAVRKVADRYFPVGEDGVRRNGRADQEIAKARRRMSTSRENGAKGGRPKKAGENPVGIPAGNPAGFEETGFEEPRRNLRETGSGEALQTPQAISTPDTSQRTDRSPSTRSPAADHSAALSRLGVRVTPHDPRLLEAVVEGVTVQHLADLAQANPGKGAPYLIATARGQLRDSANGAPNGTDQPRESLVDRNARRAREIFGRTGTH